MAVIDPKKLLPESTKTTSILVPKKNVTVTSAGVPALKPAAQPENLGSKLVVKKLIKIDEVLQDTLKVKKDKEKKEDQIQEKEDRDKREAALEKKDKGKKKSDKLFSVPKSGGLDWLSNWLQWTTIGFLFNNFKSFLDYIAPIWNNVIKPLGKILYNVFTAIVTGVTTFIELGYNAYTSIEGLIGDLGGEDAKEEFNKATGALTTAFNVAIIGLMIAASTRPGGGRPGRGGTPTKPGRGGGPVRPGTGGRPKVTTSGGGRAGGIGLRNPFRQRPTVSQGGAGTKITQAVGNRLTGKGAARVTTGAAGKLGLRAAGKAIKPILSRVPFVGGLLEFFISWAVGDPIGKAAFRGVGMTLGSWIGGLLGTLIPVPFVGTAIGAFLGGMGAAELAGLMYDGIFGNQNSSKPKVEKKKGGGKVGAKEKPKTGRSIGRRKKKTKVTSVSKTETLPGKDFAGKKKIEEFYGKDKGFLGTGFGAKQDTPYDALYQSSKIAKQNKALNGVIGSLIGTGIDLTLGQKPSSSTIKQISTTLSTFVQASMQAEMDDTVKDIRQLFALEKGGKVPSRSIGRRENNPVLQMRQSIERGISSSIQTTSTEIFAKIRTAMTGKKEEDKKRERENNTSTYQSTSGGGGYAASNLTGIALQRIGGDTEFLKEIKRVSEKFGIREGDLLGLMASESGLNPAISNGTHVGLIQFSKDSAAAVGTTQSALVKMTRAQQMKYVDKYFQYWKDAGYFPENPTAGQLYAVVFAPAYSGRGVDEALYSKGSAAYADNAPLDINNDGMITIGEMAARIEKKKKDFGISDILTLSPNAPGGGKVATGLKNWDNYGQIRKGGRVHGGLDVAAPSGTPLTAVADGVYKDQDFESGWGYFLVYQAAGRYHLYAHLSKYAGKKKGDKVKAGEIIGYVGSTGQSTGPHLHWEMGTTWTGLVIEGRSDPSKAYNWKLPFTVGRKTETKAAPTTPPKSISPSSLMKSANYDVVIPLDHTKKPGTVPDTPGGSTFKNSNATGAAGREREHQDKAARIIAARLSAQGLRVRIMTPEEYNSYQDYDKALTKYAAQGVRIVPLHFDAIRGAGGIGFLTRTRAGDAEDAAFAAPIQAVLEEFQRNNPDLGNISSDTMGNATINRAAASPAALVELGVMVDWEKKYGSNFTQTDKFRGFANDVADAIFEAGGFKPQTQASVAPPVTREVASLQRTPDYADGQTTILYQKELVMVG